MPFPAGSGAADPPARTAAESACAPGRAGLRSACQPPGLVLPLTGILHAETVLQYIGKGRGAGPLFSFPCFLQKNDHTISALPRKCIRSSFAILSPAHFGMEKRIHLFHAMTHLRQNGFFWSRESGSFFLLQRVSCEGCGLTPLYILQVSLAGPAPP